MVLVVSLVGIRGIMTLQAEFGSACNLISLNYCHGDVARPSCRVIMVVVFIQILCVSFRLQYLTDAAFIIFSWRIEGN